MPEKNIADILDLSKYFSSATPDRQRSDFVQDMPSPSGQGAPSSQGEEEGAMFELPILDSLAISRCHVYLPDMRRPVSAVFYQNQFYCYVKMFSDQQAATRAANRLQIRDNPVILTRVPKGFVLWVMEPDAKPTPSFLVDG